MGVRRGAWESQHAPWKEAAAVGRGGGRAADLHGRRGSCGQGGYGVAVAAGPWGERMRRGHVDGE